MKSFLITVAILLATLPSWAQNQVKIDSLKNLLKNAKEDTNKVNLLVLLSGELTDKSTLDFNQKALQLSEKLNFKKGIANALNNNGYYFESHSDIPKALEYYTKSLKILKEIGDRGNIANVMNNMGLSYSKIGDNANALKFFSESLIIRESIKDKRGMAESLTNLGYFYNTKGEVGKALPYLLKSIKITEEIGDKKGTADAFNNLGYIYYQKGDPLNALTHFEKSAKIQKEIGNRKGAADVLHNIGYINMNLGKPQVAMDKFTESLTLRQQVGDTLGIASSYSVIGINYLNQGNTHTAIDYYFKSLRIQERISDKSGMAYSFENIAKIFMLQNMMTKSLEYHHKSLKLREGVEDRRGIFLSLNNISTVYNRLNNIQKATEYSKKSLELSTKMGYKEGIAIALFALGDLAQKQKDYESATNYYKKSLVGFEEIAEKANVSELFYKMGSIHYEQRDYKKATEYLKKSLQLAKEIRNPSKISNASGVLSKIYATNGRFNDAYQMHLLFKEMADSVNNIEIKKETVKKQMQYEFEKKEAITKAEYGKQRAVAATKSRATLINWGIGVAALILISMISIYFYRKRENYRYEQQVNEVRQEALNAQISDHFISNTMDSINDFVEANEKEKASDYLLRFNRLIRKVLENSFKKLVSLQDDLKVLEGYLQLEKLRFAENEFTYSVVIDKKIDPASTQIPPMVLQILAENSIKHGLKKEHGGHILLSVKKQQNTILCIVEDNGIGRAASKELKSSDESNVKTSLGTGLAETLIKLFSGIAGETSFKFIDLFDDKHNATGTRVEFTIPFVSTN